MVIMHSVVGDNSGRLHYKQFIIDVVCLFIMAFLVTGCSRGNSNSETPEIEGKVPLKVQTCVVQVEKDAQSVTLSGFTEPIRRSTPSARIMAKVIEAVFHEGDRVEAGRTLIHLDTRDLLARKRQARAALDTASTALDVALMNLERMNNLQKSGTVSRQQLEAAQVGHAQANAAAAGARSAVDELDVNLSYAGARAPFKGVIVRKMVEKGNMVTPGQPLFIIEDDSRLRVIAPVGTDLAAGLKPGQELPVRMGGESVQGRIEGVVPSGATEAPGLRVQLIIDNAGHRFRAGTLAVVEIPLAGSKVERILIPRGALVERGRLTGAYVVTKDKEARLHWLILDEKPGAMVNVLSGLHEGDRIILYPEKAGIADGIPVKEINP
jgi:RND family efflux transporter MFP subunit